MESRFVMLILLQLKISLNKDCLDLKLGTGWDSSKDLSKWGFCRSGIRNISIETIRFVYAQRISMIHTLSKSIFGSNLYRALRLYLGDVKCFQSNPLSLTGYSFDFEVLLDCNGNPIQIPMTWKQNSLVLLRSSIGLKRDVKVIKKHLKPKAMVLDNVIDSMKESEDVTSSRDFDVNLSELGSISNTQCVNIASDWGYKFVTYPKNVSRKVVIEANGPFHYTRNCGHCMGYTVLKERHIRSLGWELITVSYSSKLKVGVLLVVCFYNKELGQFLCVFFSSEQIVSYIV